MRYRQPNRIAQKGCTRMVEGENMALDFARKKLLMRVIGPHPQAISQMGCIIRNSCSHFFPKNLILTT